MKKTIIILTLCAVLFTGCNVITDTTEVTTIGETTDTTTVETTTSAPQTSEVEYVTPAVIPYEKGEFTLDNPEYEHLIYENNYDVSFLSEDLQQQFLDAKFLAYALESFPMDLGFCTYADMNSLKTQAVIDIIDENVLYGQGSYIISTISYDSFIENINEIFTEDYLEKTIDNDKYFDYNGYLTIVNGEGGNVLGFKEIEFELVSETEDKIEFVGTATYTEDNSADSPIRDIREYEFVIIDTENGWRFDEFPIWN